MQANSPPRRNDTKTYIKTAPRHLPQNPYCPGRPAYLLLMPDGAMLVSDEQLGAIYRISYSGGKKK